MSSRKATLEKTDNDSYTAEWDALEVIETFRTIYKTCREEAIAAD